MDQKHVNTGSVVTGVIVIVCGVITAPLAIGFLFAFPDVIGWVGVVLIGCCFLMIRGGIISIREAKRKEQQMQEEMFRLWAESSKRQSETQMPKKATAPLESTPTTEPETASATAPRPILHSIPSQVDNPTPVAPEFTTPKPSNEVLATWYFNAAEWKQFKKIEKGRRTTSTWIEAIAITALGTWVIMDQRGAPLPIAVAVSLALAAIISFLRMHLTMGSYRSVLSKNTVILSDQSVMINGGLNPYRNEKFWLKAIKLLEGTPDVIEITYAWKTRGGNTHEELRVPVPEGKRQEALEVITKIKSLGTETDMPQEDDIGESD